MKNKLIEIHITEIIAPHVIADSKLIESIQEIGQIQPITISRNNRIMAGHHRVAAIKWLYEKGLHDGTMQAKKI